MLKSLEVMTLAALSIGLVVFAAPDANAATLSSGIAQTAPNTTETMAIADWLEIGETLIRGCLKSQKRH